MRINGIQNDNIAFGAKLEIYGKYFVSEELSKLTAKAKKVGFENDVIELNYVDYRDKSIEFFNERINDCLPRISGILKARFLPNGEGIGTELFKEKMAAECYKDFWAKEDNAANQYLDRLVKKYPNDFIGVSIIEN